MAVALGCLGAAGPASAATLYVAPSGSGSACSAAVPCGSMGAAYQVAKLGDTVLMAGGSYPKQTLGARSLPGTDSLTSSGEEVTFRPQPGASVSIDGLALGAAHGGPVEHVAFVGLSFSDWVVTRSGADVHFAFTKHEGQLHANWARYLSYRGVEVGPFTDDTGDGLQFNQVDGRGGDHILVEGSAIHDIHPNNSSAHPDAIQFYGTYNDVTLRGNRLWNNDNINYRGDGTMERLVVENNFFGASRDPVVRRYFSAQIQGNGAVIRYNSFVGAVQPAGDDERSGQLWEGNVLTWTNCDVVDSDSTVRYNVWVGGARCGSAAKGVSDAKFVDPASGDLHLRPDSPAVGAGNPASYPGSDVDGHGRPAGSAPDAGADEWGSGSSGEAPPAKPRRKRLLTVAGIHRTRRGLVLRLRLARPARVGASVHRRRQGRYRSVRRLHRRPLEAGRARLRLGHLRRGRFRVRVVAVAKSGERKRAALRFRVRRR